MKVILDANVAIAAVAARGLCEATMELCLESHDIVLSEDILGDIEEKLREKLKVSERVVGAYLALLRNNASILKPEQVRTNACRDPDDLKVLGLVGPGKAEVTVTGDKDLLVIREFKGAQILTPREFWEINKSRRKGPGIGQDQGVRHDDLDHLAGTWTEADENSFREATEPFGQIDEGMWK